MSMLEILLTVLVVNVCTTLVRTEVCLSDECRITSEYIQNNINMSADPCVDWYNFACGGWLKQNDIPADVYKWSPIVEVGKKIEKQLIDILDDKSWEFKHRNSTAVRKIKHLYWSCKDFSTTQSKKSEPLRKLIDEYGSWTVAPTNTSWSRRDWTLQEALQRAHNLTGTSFFSIDVHVDQKNSSRNIIYFYQSGLTFKRRTSEYSDTTLRNDFMTAGTTVGLNLGGCNETVRIKMYQVYQLERALARIFISDEYAKDLNNLYNPMNLTEFQRMLGNWIDIEEYMNAIFGPGVITADEQIIVQTPTYFRQLGDIILLTDTEVLANYIMWNLVLPTMGYLSSDFYKADVELQSQFGTKINAQQSKSYTWSVQCFMESKKIMPFVSSALFVDRHYSQEFNIKVATAMDNIEHAFINNLDQLSWIDEETKINLTEKARALTNLVGYPDWILDPCKLDAKYEDLVIEEGEFFQNFLYYTKFEKDNSKRQLRHPPDRKKWYMYPHDGMAYYFPIGNQMGIMAGLLQEPIISQYYP
ncbi:Endothelin-converting enzyme 1, partial [Bulinus truncatus]